MGGGSVVSLLVGPAAFFRRIGCVYVAFDGYNDQTRDVVGQGSTVTHVYIYIYIYHGDNEI